MRGNINSNKGITLVALILYIIVTIIVISMLSLVMTHFRNNLGDLDEKSVQEAEFDKLNLYLLKEAKEEDNFVVTVIDEDEDEKAEKLVLFNGNTYTFVEDEKAIYLNNNIKVAQGIEACEFSYEDDVDKRQETLTVRISVNGQEHTTEYIFVREIFLTEPGVRTTTDSIYRSTNKAAIIPEGFTISGIETEQGITTGLVVYIIPNGEDTTAENFWTKDENENNYADVMETYDQFVWIPVDDINDMYMCQSEDGTKSCKIIVEHNQAICKTHSSIMMAGRLYTSTLTDTTQKYNGTTVREPDIVNGNDATYYTRIENILNLGWTSVNDFKLYLQEEYNVIVKSILSNKGFFVGRFRASTTALSVYTATYANMDWYNAYAKFINSKIGDNIGSAMIQGAAFDQIVKFTNAYETNEAILKNIYHLQSGNTWTTQKVNTSIRREVRNPARAGGGSTLTARTGRVMVYIIN